MALLLAVCAWLIAGIEGVVWTAIAAGILLALSPQVSPRLVLRIYGARQLGPMEFPEGISMLRALAARAGLPHVPALCYVPSSIPNAFAVGSREEAVIAVSDGMLRILNPRELAGVLAHEISHIRNNDVRVMALADLVSRLTRGMSLAGMVLLFVSLPLMMAGQGSVPWLLVALLVVAPTLGSLMQLALSRAREYDADLDAAGLTGDPAGLASALRKLDRLKGRFWEEILLPGRRMPDPSLLRTHPPTDERVRRLMSLYAPEPPAPVWTGRTLVPPSGVVRVTAPPRWRPIGIWY